MNRVAPLPDPAASGSEGSRPQVTADIGRGVIRLLADLGIAALPELPLANGRRVDVIGLGRDGGIHVVEIKSSRADFMTDCKWPDYLEFAERFYFAVAVDFPLDLLPEDEGLILADRYGAELVRPARHRPLAAARRKAVTLRFARLAAQRLALPLLAPDAGLPLQPEPQDPSP
ncbi:MAG: MmcB family DNA repair protein [Geminicoccaceae bacterium]|nr:MmcB family DNA repair protein [Geminicoccaceae bacterium]HRY25311.1 MmcB family DNA repair protein [Geminicoccaceae bacterium]